MDDKTTFIPFQPPSKPLGPPVSVFGGQPPSLSPAPIKPASPFPLTPPSPAQTKPLQSEPIPAKPSLEPKPIIQPAPPNPPPTTPPIAPPPSSKLGGPLFFDIFSFLPFIIGFIVIIGLVFLAIKFLPGFFQKSTPSQVTLSYWGLWEDPTTMRVVLGQFEKENPNIKVDYKKWDLKQYRETLSSRIQEGIGPDLFKFHNSWLPMFKDRLIPIPDDVLTPQQFDELYPKVVRKDLEDKGAIYGIPLSIDTLALFINTQMFEAAGLTPPESWEELQKTAAQLTVKDELNKVKTAGVALGTFDNINHASDIISLMVLQNYGNLDNNQSTTAVSKNAQDAVCFYIAFAKNNSPECNRGSAFVWDESQDPSLLAFSKNSLAMYFGYSWDIFTIKTINPDLSFQIVKVPQLPSQNLNMASYWVEGVSKKSKHQKEALELLKFLTKKETMQKLYSEAAKTRLFGAPYARLDLAETLKDAPLVSVFLEQAKTAASTRFASDTFDNGLNQELNSYLGDAVRKILGNTSLSSAFETLGLGISTVYEKYGISKNP